MMNSAFPPCLIVGDGQSVPGEEHVLFRPIENALNVPETDGLVISDT